MRNLKQLAARLVETIFGQGQLIASTSSQGEDNKLGGTELVTCAPVDPAQVDSKAGERMTGVPAALVRLDTYIWYLIFRNLDAQEDFYNLCLVSKTFNSLTVTHLYNYIYLGPRSLTEEELRQYRLHRVFPNQYDIDKKKRKKMQSSKAQWDESCTLIRRLVGDPGGIQARAVREVEVGDFLGISKDIVSELNEKGGLATLVKALPNLQHFRLHSSSSYFEDLIRSLNDYANHPQLHLLSEEGLRVVTCPLSCVTTICAGLDTVRYTRDQPNRRIACLQQLFFACPNLKSFSLSTYGGNPGGCFTVIPHHRRVFLHCTGEETFPQLESLSVDSYMRLEEWHHWQDKRNWSNLRSLSLGPKLDTDLLELLTGCAKALRSLTVETWPSENYDMDWEGEDHSWNWEGEETCPELDGFLMAFDTLEQLTVRGVSVTNLALTKHSGLKQLCLHAIELPRDGAPRPTPDVADLNELDANCPDLEILEIDIYRDSGWPNDILKTLATGFVKLRHLTLHCEVGIDFNSLSSIERNGDNKEPHFPRLDGDLAREFAQPFFNLRSWSRLEMLTLKTGETLRIQTGWQPVWRPMEHAYSGTINIRAPSVVDIEDRWVRLE